MTKTLNELCLKGYLLKDRVKNTIVDSLKSKEGDGFVDTAIKILISVVIGAFVLYSLYALFKDVVIPKTSGRVESMFDYKG